MPEGRGGLFWKPTNPKEDQRRLSEQNQAQGGMLLPTVRMVKWWNQACNSHRLKGIHIEVMVERALAGQELEGIGHALHLAFLGIWNQLWSPCNDPTGLGPALDVNLSDSDRRLSGALSLGALLSTIEATNAFQAWDLPGGKVAWRKVFPQL